MLELQYHKTYQKDIARRSREEKYLIKEMLGLFIEDPHHPALRNHPLDPPMDRYRSISVDDDLRIILRMIDSSTALLLRIGTHEEVYER